MSETTFYSTSGSVFSCEHGSSFIEEDSHGSTIDEDGESQMVDEESCSLILPEACSLNFADNLRYVYDIGPTGRFQIWDLLLALKFHEFSETYHVSERPN